jgi:hypothetical protein
MSIVARLTDSDDAFLYPESCSGRRFPMNFMAIVCNGWWHSSPFLRPQHYLLPIANPLASFSVPPCTTIGTLPSNSAVLVSVVNAHYARKELCIAIEPLAFLGNRISLPPCFASWTCTKQREINGAMVKRKGHRQDRTKGCHQQWSRQRPVRNGPPQ